MEWILLLFIFFSIQFSVSFQSLCIASSWYYSISVLTATVNFAFVAMRRSTNSNTHVPAHMNWKFCHTKKKLWKNLNLFVFLAKVRVEKTVITPTKQTCAKWKLWWSQCILPILANAFRSYLNPNWHFFGQFLAFSFFSECVRFATMWSYSTLNQRNVCISCFSTKICFFFFGFILLIYCSGLIFVQW